MTKLRTTLAVAALALPLALAAAPAQADGRQIFKQNECFTQQEPQLCVNNHTAYRDETKPNGSYVLQFNQVIVFTFTYRDGRVVAERSNIQYKLTFRAGVVEESYHFNIRTKTADCTEVVHTKQVKNRIVVDTVDVRC